MKYRKHIRLKDYNYKADGYYFVTICCSGRAQLCLKYKDIIEKHLKGLENHRGVRLDYFKLMPDHLHFILVLEEAELTLSRYIQEFKSKTTVEIKEKGFDGMRLWQPNYYEHIIRNERALEGIRKYIEYNPDIERLDWNELDR